MSGSDTCNKYGQTDCVEVDTVYSTDNNVKIEENIDLKTLAPTWWKCGEWCEKVC